MMTQTELDMLAAEAHHAEIALHTTMHRDHPQMQFSALMVHDAVAALYAYAATALTTSSSLNSLIEDAVGWSAVWHDWTVRGVEPRSVRITVVQFKTFRKWPGVKVVRLQQEQEL